MDSLDSIEFEVISRLRDLHAAGRGKAKLALPFYFDCGFSFMPYKAINTFL